MGAAPTSRWVAECTAGPVNSSVSLGSALPERHGRLLGVPGAVCAGSPPLPSITLTKSGAVHFPSRRSLSPGAPVRRGSSLPISHSSILIATPPMLAAIPYTVSGR